MTAAAVAKLKTPKPGVGTEYFDASFPGLSLRITPRGAKTFALMTRINGRQKRITLGRWPALGLADARKKATDLLDQIDRGEDPTRNDDDDRDLVENVVAEWIERDQSKNKGVDGVRRLFDKDVLPRWRGRLIHDIKRRDVIDVIDAIVDRGAVIHARRMHAHLHRMFRWSVGRGIIDVNPMADLPKPGRENPRDRVLDDDELARVWHASLRMGYPFGPQIRLLILTGARLTEIAACTRDELDTDRGMIALDGDRTKNGEPRIIPLSQQALDVLDPLPVVLTGSRRKQRPSDYVFTTTGDTHAAVGFKARRRLDALVAGVDAGGADLEEDQPINYWRTHDLRRTVATGLQRLGVRLEVTEAVLGHTSGSKSGIVGVYQRHDWAHEKCAALDAWCRYVGLIVTPAGAEVARMLDAGPVERVEFQAAIMAGGSVWNTYLSRRFPRSHAALLAS